MDLLDFGIKLTTIHRETGLTLQQLELLKGKMQAGAAPQRSAQNGSSLSREQWHPRVNVVGKLANLSPGSDLKFLIQLLESIVLDCTMSEKDMKVFALYGEVIRACSDEALLQDTIPPLMFYLFRTSDLDRAKEDWEKGI